MKSVKQYSKEFGISTDEIIKQAARMNGGLEQWYNEQSAKFTKSGMDVGMLAEKWGMSIAEIEAYCQQWGMNYDEFNEEMKATHTDAGLSVEELAAKWGTTTQEIERQMAMQEIDLQEWSDNQDARLEEWNRAVEENTNSIINSFEELPTKMDYSLEEMTAILNANAEKYAAWKEKMVQVSSLLSPEAMAQIEQLGPGTSEILDEIIADTTGTKAAELNAAFEKVGSSAVTGMEQSIPQATITGGEIASAVGASISSSTAPIEATQEQVNQISAALANGDYSGLTTGMANSIKAGVGAVSVAVNLVSAKVQTNLTEMSAKSLQIIATMMINITSKISSSQFVVASATATVVNAVKTTLDTLHGKTQESIQKVIEIIQTELGKTANVVAAAENIVTSVISKFSGLTPQAKAMIGDMFAGMVSAMDAYSNSLYSKAQAIANNIIRILKTAFSIHSPSRVTYDIFQNVMKGAINAMDNGSEELIALTKTNSFRLIAQFEAIPVETRLDWGRQFKNAMASTHNDIAKGMSVFVGLKDHKNDIGANSSSDNNKMIALLAEQNKLLSALLNKNEDVYLGTTKVGSKLKQWDKDRGMQISKGVFDDVY